MNSEVSTSVLSNQTNLNTLSLASNSSLIKTKLSNEISKLLDVKFEVRNAIIKNDLLTNNYDSKYQLTNNTNTKLIRDLFEIVNSMPKLLEITQTKPETPTFEQIQELKTDTAEIKKFIRKVNYEMAGYYCNHNSINEKCEKIYNNISNIYETEEFIDYMAFISQIIRIISSIISKDSKGLVYNISPPDPLLIDDPNEFSLGFISKYRIKEVADEIIKINGMISNSNAQTNKSCSKCKAAVKKFNYCLFQIEQMRQELKEQEEIDKQPDENKFDMKAFLQKNYPSLDRFLLKDVQTKYKTEFKIHITYNNLKKKIEDTKLFTVSNVHNVMYVNRK